MSTHHARLSFPGQPPYAHAPTQQPSIYERTYWDRLTEPSFLFSAALFVATVLYTTNLSHHLLPVPVLDRLWNLLVTITPSSLLYTLDDWTSPFPLPRVPSDRASPAARHESKSRTLARLLGRDKTTVRSRNNSGSSNRNGTGFISSVAFAGKSSFSRLMLKGDVDQPAGLGNLSNSCYQNSILQSLSALAPLREYLAWITREEEAGNLPPIETAHTLAKVVYDLSNVAANGETLWTPPVLKRMSTFQQQDAQEYFCKLLNEVQDEVEKALKTMQQKPGFDTNLDHGRHEPARGSLGSGESSGDRDGDSDRSDRSDRSDHSDRSGSALKLAAAATHASSYRIPLEGLMAQRIVCRSCGYSSGLNMSPFYCLTLSLGYGNAEYSLEETLDSFSAVENIEGVQCARCTLLKFRDRIRTIIGRFEAESGLDAQGTRRKQPVPYERLEAIETALADDDFEEKTLVEKCRIPNKQRVESTKSRQVGIARAPPSIAIHINRSRFDESTGYTFKNPAAIRFPLRLDLGPWCLGSAASRSLATACDAQGREGKDEDQENENVESAENDKNVKKAKKEDDEKKDDNKNMANQQALSSTSSLPSLTSDSSAATDDEEQWQLPPQLPMVSGTQYDSKITGPLYELRAVITHYGQHENGHYVCYRKHAVRPRPPPDESTESKPPNPKIQLAAGEGGLETEGDRELDDGAADGDAELLGFDVLEKSEDAEQEPRMDEPQWWRLSDQTVTLSSEAAVLSQGGVFMLFYDKIDAESVFTDSGSKRSATAQSLEDMEDSQSLESASEFVYTDGKLDSTPNGEPAKDRSGVTGASSVEAGLATAGEGGKE